MNIVLAGMPGSGKTTVLKEFSKRGRKVVDTDEEIVKKHGAISEIFERRGEEYFRELEAETVREVSSLGGAVIATGGGCLMRPENVRRFKESGKIVYLRTAVDTLAKRVEGNFDRPLLRGDVSAKLIELHEKRAKIYEQAADIIIDTDTLTPKQIADKISEKI